VGPFAAQLALGHDDRRREPRGLAPADGRDGGAVPPAASAAGVDELAERLSDIERRLARIEAELGALR
jgi:hypothetical protein